MLRPCFLILASSLLVTQPAWAEPATPEATPDTGAAAAAGESESQQFARARLMDMARFLAGTEQFSVRLRVGYDSVQDTGQKIEFGEIRKIEVQRPDRARIEEVASHGGRDLLLFDGTNITTFDAGTGLYAQVPQPGDLDSTIVYFVRDLRMRLPLAPLLMARFPEELQRRVQSVEYVETTDILGEPAHHIAARTANVDFQVWIADSERPLPLRIVMTYTQAEGQPQFWADFSRWDLTPRLNRKQFEFTPPSGARQIVFAVQVPPLANPVNPDEAQQPGDKP